MQSFANALDGKNDSRELVLSAADINALIQNDPQYKDVRDKLFVMLDGDQIKGRISVPLDQIHSQFKGRYLNGTATLKVSLQNGALDVRLQDVDVGGKPLPGPVMSGFKNVNLAQDAQKDQKARANLEKFESIEVKDSKLIIRAKEPVSKSSSINRISGPPRLLSAAGLLILGHRFRHESFQVLDTSRVGRVSRGKFGSLCFAGAAHAFPEGNRLVRIISGSSHVEQAHFVRFSFVFATEREDYPVLGSSAKGGHDG